MTLKRKKSGDRCVQTSRLAGTGSKGLFPEANRSFRSKNKNQVSKGEREGGRESQVTSGHVTTESPSLREEGRHRDGREWDRTSGSSDRNYRQENVTKEDIL